MISTATQRRIHRWLASIKRPSSIPHTDEMKQRLNHQLELLRDEIAAARHAGLSWHAIGKMIGLSPDTVQSIDAE